MAQDADERLDAAATELYQLDPSEFTARRNALAAQARTDGNADLAKQISALRKPSIAASIVNRLIHEQDDVRQRLSALGDDLRAAHQSLDPDEIRRLSGKRRALVAELTRAALTASDTTNPSATVRDDVAGTFNAAIADPTVAAQLGRLATARHWSGFGEVFESGPPALRVVQGGRNESRRTRTESPAKARAKVAEETSSRAETVSAVRGELDTASAVLAQAEEAAEEAAAELARRRGELAVARSARDSIRKQLDTADGRVEAAEAHLERASRSSADAAALVRAARREQRRRRDALAKARGRG
jgi:hypothetical protein